MLRAEIESEILNSFLFQVGLGINFLGRPNMVGIWRFIGGGKGEGIGHIWRKLLTQNIISKSTEYFKMPLSLQYRCWRELVLWRSPRRGDRDTIHECLWWTEARVCSRRDRGAPRWRVRRRTRLKPRARDDPNSSSKFIFWRVFISREKHRRNQQAFFPEKCKR